jgi:LPXTG-motif cell wall-anchored protein
VKNSSKRNKVISIVLIVLAVLLSGVAIYVANLINSKENVGPKESQAAEAGLPGVLATGWAKVTDAPQGHSLGVVQGKLIGLSTLPGDKCSGLSSMYVTSEGTSWSKKDIGAIGCLDSFIEYNGKMAISQYPNSGIQLVDLDGKYYPPAAEGGDLEQNKGDQSYVHPWGDVIWRWSTMIGVHDFGQSGVANDLTPAGSKIILVDRQMGGDSVEADYISVYPRRYSGKDDNGVTRWENGVVRMNPRISRNEWGSGVLVGDNLFIAGNVFQGNGRMYKFAYKNYPPIQTLGDMGSFPVMPGGVVAESPDANIRSVYYDTTTNLMYVTGFFQESQGNVPVVYSMDVNGRVTGTVRGLADSGYEAMSSRVFNGKLYVTLQGAGKNPGINVCDLDAAGAVKSCGFMEQFDGYKDLAVFNNAIYAIGPNGIYRLTAAVPTPSPTVSPEPSPEPTATREPQVTPSPSAAPSASPTVSVSPTVTTTREPAATVTPSASPTASAAPTQTSEPVSTEVPVTPIPTSPALPDTGTTENILLVAGGILLVGFGVVIGTRRKEQTIW